MKCGALILAAGASTRLGQPKQLVRLEGETLLVRSVRVAREAGCAPIVVVLGAFEDLIRSQCNLEDVQVILNPEWSEGMGTSLACGVGAFEEDQSVEGVVIMTCDMPAVTADHLRLLASSGDVTASSYANRKGVPAYFPSSLFSRLIELKGDAGAREILRSANAVPLTNGELDIDTIVDLARAQRQSLDRH